MMSRIKSLIGAQADTTVALEDPVICYMVFFVSEINFSLNLN